MDIFLWGVLPYVMVVILVGGSLWRYKYDQFGWTTRSSQLYESKLLRIGSPVFHFGLLAVIAGHFFGLVIPKSWTEAVGMSEDLYHFNALFVGTIAGVGTLGGIVLLIYRRRKTGPVFMATTKNDKLMYVVLVAAIVFGLWTTLASVFFDEHGVTYRETVSPWFRSLFIFQPDVASMAAAPLSFHMHTIVGMLLFMVWPFTRLVHAFTAPLHYLFRPYIVYRSRDKGPTVANQHGWSDVGTRDSDTRHR
ncbi:respiratory nitrate reductase subunit gamma [Arthrobacter sp. H35-D1]|uniref:respiratory nitrate reductase subunit gamma n=1 Tax=Arthrobacter sp. H35-D1 TaxID=3046202 RepID=UPI0024B989DD|nr:respiratory nitrate reductase subunit gamma [Arthrobacter sp. H35-D1]MDJ0311888.1 respiratory nitrate reductase subunit gamma [Arthrobacter sp. H35-D1]